MASRIIKKYANRRLYDTEDSKYVTAKDIKNIIALGHDITVIDDTSNEDITRVLLLQVLSEQELGGRPLLSKAVLKQLIRFYGHPMQDMMSGYIATSVNQFMAQMETMQEQMEQLLDASPFANLQELTAKNLQAMADLQRQFFNPMMNKSPPTKDPEK
ncbi:MAG: polyhydroxyalkanoate synthesis repressor PhaR [Cellvibrionaceae bacterium]|nr:polyhydroxyalkanoate synthesis repressor PhaR [Cellvibrionaceae bacterium]